MSGLFPVGARRWFWRGAAVLLLLTLAGGGCDLSSSSDGGSSSGDGDAGFSAADYPRLTDASLTVSRPDGTTPDKARRGDTVIVQADAVFPTGSAATPDGVLFEVQGEDSTDGTATLSAGDTELEVRFDITNANQLSVNGVRIDLTDQSGRRSAWRHDPTQGSTYLVATYYDANGNEVREELSTVPTLSVIIENLPDNAISRDPALPTVVELDEEVTLFTLQWEDGFLAFSTQASRAYGIYLYGADPAPLLLEVGQALDGEYLPDVMYGAGTGLAQGGFLSELGRETYTAHIGGTNAAYGDFVVYVIEAPVSGDGDSGSMLSPVTITLDAADPVWFGGRVFNDSVDQDWLTFTSGSSAGNVTLTFQYLTHDLVYSVYESDGTTLVAGTEDTAVPADWDPHSLTFEVEASTVYLIPLQPTFEGAIPWGAAVVGMVKVETQP